MRRARTPVAGQVVGGLDGLAEEVEVDGAGVALRGEAGVEGDRGDTAFAGDMDDFTPDGGTGVGTQTRLEGDGQADGADDDLEDFAQAREVFEEGGTGALGRDAGDGTAGVEVDALEAAEGLNAFGGLGEAVGLGAIEVRPDVAFLGEGL